MVRDCREIRNLLPEFLSNRGDDEERQAVREHLERCVSCQKESLALKETFKALEGSKKPTLASTYWTNFLPRLHDRLNEERRRKRELAPWVYKVLVPSAGLLITVFLLSRIGIVPKPGESLLVERQLVEQMSSAEFHQLAESSFDPLFPESSSRLETLLPRDEQTLHAINSLIATSSDEVIRLHEASLHGSVDLGLEDLTDEEMEAVIQRLEGDGTL
jgi:anti-sigma factor RsiW